MIRLLLSLLALLTGVAVPGMAQARMPACGTEIGAPVQAVEAGEVAVAGRTVPSRPAPGLSAIPCARPFAAGWPLAPAVRIGIDRARE